MIAIDTDKVIGFGLLAAVVVAGGWYFKEGPGSRGGAVSDLFANDGERAALDQFRAQARQVRVGDAMQTAEDKMGRPFDKSTANATSRELVWKGPLGATLTVTVETANNHVSFVDVK